MYQFSVLFSILSKGFFWDTTGKRENFQTGALLVKQEKPSLTDEA